MIISWAEWLRDSESSQYIQQDATFFPKMEILHVIAIALVVGSIFVVDLRLMNVCSKTYPLRRLMRTVLPITIIAFVAALVSGFLMFASQPVRYLHTPIFVVKMGLLVLAGLNMLIFHLWSHKSIASWDAGGTVPIAARTAGLISLVLWTAILFAGRFVGFLLAF